MNWVITGGRSIEDVQTIYNQLDKMVENYGRPDLFIHGACSGVDSIGGRWAKERGIPIEEYPAQWSRYGKKAGPIRNHQMAQRCGKDGFCFAFWNGVSKGTAGMIKICQDMGIKTYVTIIRDKNKEG